MNLYEYEGQSTGSKVGSSPLMVEKILDLFPTHALKMARLVSHLWNSEVVKILPNRKIVLSISQASVDSSNSVLLSDFETSYLNPTQFPRWRIQLPQDEVRTTHLVWRAERDAQVLRHLTMFLSQQPPTHVTSLHLLGGFMTPPSLNMFALVMASFKDTLTSLYLEKFNWTSDSFPPSSLDLKFPALQFLSLGMDADLNEPRHMTAFLDWFLPKVRDISTLQLQSYKPNSHAIYTSVLSWIASAQKVGLFHNLRHLRSDVSGKFLCNSLLDLQSFSLKTLAWGGLSTPTSEDFWTLICHDRSLEEVTLQFEEGNDANIFDFPTMMPNLKRLSIFVYSRRGSELDMTVSFGGRNVMTFMEYASNHFHSLETLTVWPVDYTGLPDELPIATSASWGKFLPVLAAFLPIRNPGRGRATPFPYLRHLDIPFLLRGKYHRSLDDLETFFPNVAFPFELTTARAGPVWNPDEGQNDEMEVDSWEEEEEEQSSEEGWD